MSLNLFKKIFKISIIFIISIFLLRLVLSNTYEIYQHNIWTSWNKVFISKDWHNEIVFNSKWEAVSDFSNVWSYNFYHPINKPFLHFRYDTLPWIIWWNSESDNSSKFQRILAFSKDFWLWIISTILYYIIVIIWLVLLYILYKIIKKNREKIFNKNYLIPKIIILFLVIFIIPFLVWKIININ